MKLVRLRQATRLGAIALSALLLQACGGGSGTASSTITPTLSGTVTGFGSVVVDGVEVEDAYARVVHENADGTLTNAVLQMGHRVRVAHDGANKASQVLIDAAVIGIVSAKDTTNKTLKVAGQDVTVNDVVNSASPVTVYGGGYTSLSDVLVNDLVQVHGTPVYDATSKTYKVQATRIQKDTGDARVQVSGKIAGYASTSSGATFTLNGLNVSTTSATVLRPSGSTLANNMQVTVYGSTLSSSGGLTATHVRVNRDQNSGSTTMQAQLSGVVSNYDATAGTFELQGSTVKVGTVAVTPTSASLSNSAYVMVKGSVASDGSISATEIRVRTNDTTTDLAKVLLIGTISDYVDDSSFVVRGVPVDASNSPTKTGCTTPFSGYTGTVKVQATQQAGTAVVLATSIECPSSNSTQLIKPYEGTIAIVDSTAKTFSLTLSSGSAQKVLWNDTTTFNGLTATTLQGKQVHVDGYTDTSNNFVARVVSLDDGTDASPVRDDKSFRLRHSNKETAATNYRKSRN